LPRLGDLRLDQVTYAVIEDFKIALSKTTVQNVEKTYGVVKAEVAPVRWTPEDWSVRCRRNHHHLRRTRLSFGAA
jgi:hypothetical protein